MTNATRSTGNKLRPEEHRSGSPPSWRANAFACSRLSSSSASVIVSSKRPARARNVVVGEFQRRLARPSFVGDGKGTPVVRPVGWRDL